MVQLAKNTVFVNDFGDLNNYFNKDAQFRIQLYNKLIDYYSATTRIACGYFLNDQCQGIFFKKILLLGDLCTAQFCLGIFRCILIFPLIGQLRGSFVCRLCIRLSFLQSCVCLSLILLSVCILPYFFFLFCPSVLMGDVHEQPAFAGSSNLNSRRDLNLSQFHIRWNMN